MLTAEDRQRGFRAAAEGFVFRAGIRMCTEEEPMTTIHDPNESEGTANRAAESDEARAPAAQADVEKKLAAMAAFRQEVLNNAATARFAAARPATSKVHLEPPNGDAIALARMQEQR
jgi:hypothetical protein